MAALATAVFLTSDTAGRLPCRTPTAALAAAWRPLPFGLLGLQRRAIHGGGRFGNRPGPTHRRRTRPQLPHRLPSASWCVRRLCRPCGRTPQRSHGKWAIDADRRGDRRGRLYGSAAEVKKGRIPASKDRRSVGRSGAGTTGARVTGCGGVGYVAGGRAEEVELERRGVGQPAHLRVLQRTAGNGCARTALRAHAA